MIKFISGVAVAVAIAASPILHHHVSFSGLEVKPVATQSAHRARVVWVYLDRAKEPTLVAKSMIGDIHDCHHGDCLATMRGDRTFVFVRKGDFR